MKVRKDAVEQLDYRIAALETQLAELKRARRQRKYFLAYKVGTEIQRLSYGLRHWMALESLAAAKDFGYAIYCPDTKEYWIMEM